MKLALVTTTINVPELLTSYAADINKFGHKDIEIFVAGDRKTPDGAAAYCADLQKKSGLRVHWLGVPEQEKILADYPKLAAFIPWNCVQRRNVAHLEAWRRGFDAIVAIDDDNFRIDEDYFGLHAATLSSQKTDSVSAKAGWFNPCALLHDTQNRQFYPRGYPVSHRGGHENYSYGETDARIVVNAGFWLGDPDIDAVTRLAAPIDVDAYPRGKTVALAKGTWSPFNSQNTAVHRDVLPAWFMIPSAIVGRFDDIWASYVATACAHRFGHLVAFGRPLVRQDRNAHDLWRDLDMERMGMKLTEGFCGALQSARLTEQGYAGCAMQAMDAIEHWALGETKMDESYRASLRAFVGGYRLWIEALAA